MCVRGSRAPSPAWCRPSVRLRTAFARAHLLLVRTYAGTGLRTSWPSPQGSSVQGGVEKTPLVPSPSTAACGVLANEHIPVNGYISNSCSTPRITLPAWLALLGFVGGPWGPWGVSGVHEGSVGYVSCPWTLTRLPGQKPQEKVQEGDILSVILVECKYCP